MRAGLAKIRITPPGGTPMLGFAVRDNDHGCEGAHDDLFVRALSLDDGTERALLLTFDLCFLGRGDVDRLKGAIGRHLDLGPRQILMNTSHTHTGPAVGTWAFAGYAAAEGGAPPDPLYLADLETAVVAAAQRAAAAAREVTLWAGQTRSALPMSRRKPDAHGKVPTGFRPNPAGVVDDCLPLCLLKDRAGGPVALLFSVACHPSTISGFLLSAEYPGAAARAIDAHLGAEVSMFFQGAGGDAKPRTTALVGTGEERWRPGTWDDVEAAGAQVAGEVLRAAAAGLTECAPRVRSAAVETAWGLEPAPERAEFEGLLRDPHTPTLRRLWAQRQLRQRERDGRLPSAVPITAQGVQVGEGVRLVGLEGEAVAGLGLLMRGHYRTGVTFALGYTNGQGLYLPTSPMLDEGGYEADSAWEYGLPSRLAKGMERIVLQALERLQSAGVE